MKPTGVAEYLFNIQNPEGTVKAVAESAMREVIGRSEIQPIYRRATDHRDGRSGPDAEDLDHYGAESSYSRCSYRRSIRRRR